MIYMDIKKGKRFGEEAGAHARNFIFVCNAHWQSGGYDTAGGGDPADGGCDRGGGYP